MDREAREVWINIARFEQIRLQLGVSQEDIEEEAGIAPHSITRLKRRANIGGNVRIHKATLKQLARGVWRCIRRQVVVED